MRIEFDSRHDTPLDAAAAAQALTVYIQAAARQQQQPVAPAPYESPELDKDAFLGKTADEAFDAPQTPEPDEDGPGAAPGTLDSRGFPWDERIHAKSRDGSGVLTSTGVWRAKRGVSDDLVKSVETEHRIAGFGQTSLGEVATRETYAAVVESAPPPPPVEVPQPPVVVPPPPASDEPETFETFFSKLNAMAATDLTIMGRAVPAAAKFGITLAGLATRPDLIPAVKAEMGL